MHNNDDTIQFLGGQDYSPSSESKNGKPTFPEKRRFWTKRNIALLAAAAVAVFAIAFLAGRSFQKRTRWAVDFDYPLSRSCSQIFSDLEKSSQAKADSNEAVTDSINGVKLRIMDLKGLKASMAEEMPQGSDSLVLVTNGWDYDDKGRPLGEFALNGKKAGHGTGRAGFVAITPKGWQMGISQDDSISNYVLKQGGSMFRQFALVSAGEICVKQFALKGKVHRRALARKPGSPWACYVETVNRESLYDFAEALADYGFDDAVYLTGGNSKQGGLHNKTWVAKTPANLLVFSKQKQAAHSQHPLRQPLRPVAKKSRR